MSWNRWVRSCQAANTPNSSGSNRQHRWNTQTDYYRDNGKVREDAAVVFHLCCLLLPLLFGVFAAWQERTHLFQDMVARFAVLLAFGSVALGLEQSYPQALLMWL